MRFLKEPFLQKVESTIQKGLSLESSTYATLSSLDASLSKAVSNSNCTIIRFFHRLQNPHGIYSSRLKKYNKKNDFYTHGENLESWRYEDCFRQHEKKKKDNDGKTEGVEGRMYDEQVRKYNERRFEERRREAKDRHIKGWMREMKGTSWNRKARYYRNEID